MIKAYIIFYSPWCLDNILLKDVSPESWKYSPERNTNDTEYYIFEEAGIDRFVYKNY